MSPTGCYRRFLSPPLGPTLLVLAVPPFLLPPPPQNPAVAAVTALLRRRCRPARPPAGEVVAAGALVCLGTAAAFADIDPVPAGCSLPRDGRKKLGAGGVAASAAGAGL